MWSIVRCLATWIWTPRPNGELLPQRGDANSHCGEFSSARPPQCGETATEQPEGSAGKSPTDATQCGGSAVERAVETLEALREAWKQAADAPHGGPWRPGRPQDSRFPILNASPVTPKSHRDERPPTVDSRVL